MPTEVLNVFNTATPDEFIVQPTGVTKTAALNDESNSSYIAPNDTGADQKFTLRDLLTPDIENFAGQINSITINLRMSPAKYGSGGSYRAIVVGLDYPGAAAGSLEQVVENYVSEPSVYADESVTFTQKRTGSPPNTFEDWEITDLPNLILSLRQISGGGFPQIISMSVVVDYDFTHAIDIPTSLAVDDIDSNFVTLTWSDDSDVELGYEVQRSLDGTVWETVGATLEDAETYTDTTVESDTHYHYRIRAFNSHFFSEWTDDVEDDTPPYSGPAEEPVDVEIIDVTPTSLSVVWTRPDFADSYELQRSPDGVAWGDTIPIDVSENGYKDNGLLPGAEYFYRVRAINSVGASDWVEVSQDLPERSFREFLQKEVLQDELAEFLGWNDKIHNTDNIFKVTQHLEFHANLTKEQRGFQYIIVYPLNSDYKTLFPYLEGVNLSVFIDLNTIAGSFWPWTFQIKLTSGPLTADLPGGTVIKTMSSTGPLGFRRLVVSSGIPRRVFSPTGSGLVTVVSPSGAKVGDTVIDLDYQDSSDGETGWTDPKPYPMYLTPPSQNSLTGEDWANLFAARGEEDVTVDIDYNDDQPPRNAQPVYDSITEETLVKLGKASELDVSEEEYQQFRDAGRVELWRAVVYDTVSLADGVEDLPDTNGQFSNHSQVHAMALNELAAAESVYQFRYGVQPEVFAPASKPKATSYSNSIKVIF